MKRTRMGELDVWVAGGTDGDGGGDGPGVLLCHGFGAPGNDLVPLWRAVDAGRGVRWFFPEAPLSLEAMFGAPARAWWLIDMAKLDMAMRTGRRDELKRETPDGLAEARAALESVLQELETSRGLPRERLLVGGFSQGAMITTEVALHSPKPFAGLAILSGTFLCEDRWRAAAKNTGPSLHVAQSHGRRDPLLPFTLAEELAAMLGENGASVDFVAHGGAHEIPESALAALGRLARARLQG
jgi:phospholipase/carboxylesterase